MTKRNSMPIAIVAIALAGTFGCSATFPNRTPVHFTEMKESDARLPMIIEVRKGDRIPLRARLSSDLLESDRDAKPIMLTAKRRFFIVVRDDGPPRISLDGKSYASGGKGQFALGIGNQGVTVAVSKFYVER